LRLLAPQRVLLDVNKTIHEVIAMIQGELKRTGVLLQTKLANDLPLLLGDQIQLQQVISE
jgi:C4-dicarboxylate-specific signal transduction histidine kinase